MRRRLLWLGAIALSGALVALVGLWARSYSVSDRLVSATAKTREGGAADLAHLRVISSRGWIEASWTSGRSAIVALRGADRSQFGRTLFDLRHATWRPAPPLIVTWFRVAAEDAGFVAGIRATSARAYIVNVPHWSLAAATGLALALCLPALFRGRRKTGCCPRCGYDLRATPDRCPECGHAAAASGRPTG